MRGLYPLLTTLQRHGANALVTLGEAPLEKGYGQLMLPSRGLKTDFSESVVNLFDRRVQPLVNRLVVRFSADIRPVELLTVKQGDHRVFKLHPGHFPRERHVPDGEFIFAICRELVFDAESPARTERHPFNVML